MIYENGGGRSTQISTDLYLVRVWKRKSSDGALSFHGKLQHVVSGASSYFGGLAGLPGALEKMIEEQAGSLGPDLGNATGDIPDDELHIR